MKHLQNQWDEKSLDISDKGIVVEIDPANFTSPLLKSTVFQNQDLESLKLDE